MSVIEAKKKTKTTILTKSDSYRRILQKYRKMTFAGLVQISVELWDVIDDGSPFDLGAILVRFRAAVMCIYAI